jgi:hypothetical protein
VAATVDDMALAVDSLGLTTAEHVLRKAAEVVALAVVDLRRMELKARAEEE